MVRYFFARHRLLASAAALVLASSVSSVSRAADETAASGQPPTVAEDPATSEPPAAEGGSEEAWSLAGMGLTGSVRGAVWSSNRRRDDTADVVVGSFWLRLDRKLNDTFGVFAEGYALREDLLDQNFSVSRVREAYLDVRYNDWDFRLGRQIVAWGRADRLNPTDNLTPRDFTLLAPEIDEDRFGADAAKAVLNFDDGYSVSGVWLADFAPHKLSLSSRTSANLRHDVPDSNRQWAIKFDRNGGDVDWSVSYFDGFDLFPDVRMVGVAPSGPILRLEHNRLRVIGFDAATTIGSNRYAIEAAFDRTRDSGGDDPAVKNSFFYGVFGLEHDFGDTLSGIVQVYWRHVFNYVDPQGYADPGVRTLAIEQSIAYNQWREDQYGFAARLGRKWLNETLEGEVALSSLLNGHGYQLRPRLLYAATDHLKLLCGFEYIRGSDRYPFGRNEKNTALFAEARYFF
jgi:hypothetical protein